MLTSFAFSKHAGKHIFSYTLSYTLKNRLIILSIVILIIGNTFMIPKIRVLKRKQKQPQWNE